MRLVTTTFSWTAKLLSILLLCVASSVAAAQTVSLPVNVQASGNHAEITIGTALLPVADVTLDFQDASGLSPSSLGATAQVVSLLDSTLLARLPDLDLTNLTSAFPVLLTIEPPANGGLTFRDTGRLEIHTHDLPYSVGSSFRVFKAPLLGPFRDVTDEIAKGSVRARTTYGGFSQFLILVDLRSTSVVIDEKIDWLRDKVATLPLSERDPFETLLNQTEAAVDVADYATALSAIEAFRSRAQTRAGLYIPNEWRATHDVDNQAGDLVAGANTLRFSVAYLRDFGL
ncbi:MAG TPA: DUF6689 family protein [Lysobacter sp.]|jgi:hypothetical protein|nr:DUF6689 family protein [Lysobacter sp.]